MTIGAAWLGHTEMTDRLAKADPMLLRLNLLLLLVVGALAVPDPPGSRVSDDLHGEIAFVTLYGLTLLAIRVFGFARRVRPAEAPLHG